MARILVVDDEESIRELMRQILLMQEHKVDLAKNGAEALECLRQAAYDLMIIDRMMPVMSGIEAISIARAAPKLQKLKILMFTSASVTKEIEEAYQAGADDYVIKPLNVKAFMEKVQKVLGK